MAENVPLNATVKDTLSDYEGTVIGRVVYLDDTPDLLVVSRELSDEGRPVQVWLPESRCSVV